MTRPSGRSAEALASRSWPCSRWPSGIGSTTAVFSIVQAVLLRPLPYPDVDRLVAVWAGHVREKGLSKVFARYDDLEVWQRHSQAFEQLAAATWATGDQILTGRGPARTALAIPVSVNFFSLLGVSPAIGRAFNRDDLNRGCSVVLSHRFWQGALGAADVVGQSLALDTRACAVVGVMPDRFAFYPDAAEMWTLITPNREQLPTGVGVGVFGRLRPGVSLEQAQTELTALNQDAHAHDPGGVVFVPRVYPLPDEFTWLAGRNLRLTLLVLFAAVSVVPADCLRERGESPPRTARSDGSTSLRCGPHWAQGAGASCGKC